MPYITSGQIGIDLTATTTGTTTVRENAQFTLGTRLPGSDGSEWVYVQAAEALTQYSACLIDEDFQVLMMTTTRATSAAATAGNFIGFNQVAFADNDFGWIATKGSNIRCRLKVSCAADVRLFSTTSAGKLDDASASSVLINGVASVTTITAATDAEIIASNPVSRLLTGVAS